jgi:hypothetical protein
MLTMEVLAMVPYRAIIAYESHEDLRMLPSPYFTEEDLPVAHPCNLVAQVQLSMYNKRLYNAICKSQILVSTSAFKRGYQLK